MKRKYSRTSRAQEKCMCIYNLPDLVHHRPCERESTRPTGEMCQLSWSGQWCNKSQTAVYFLKK